MRSVPCPIGGINSRDSIASMGEEFAIDMLNFLPGTRSLQCRQGYSRWVESLPAPARTLAPYISSAGEVRILGCTDDGVFDVTTKGSTPTVAHELTDGAVRYVQFGNVAGQFLVCCNGTDPSFLYDGSAFITMTQSATPSSPGQVKGVNPNLFCNVHSHKKRLWFVQKESMTAWYLPLDAVGGEAKPLYLGSVFHRGGRLQNIYTWSLDSGSGLDDILIFQSSEGELAGYVGNDPDVTDDFKLSAVHYVAPPYSFRAGADVGGELLLLTASGIYPTSKIVAGLGTVSMDSEETATKNISGDLARLVRQRGSTIGWEIRPFSASNLLFLVIPKIGNYSAVQFVMNLQTGAWGRLNLPMLTMCVVEGDMFFSDTLGKVYRYGGVFADDVALDASSSKPITARFQQAYNYFDSRGRNKHYNLIRPIWNCQYPPSYIVGVSCDYEPVDLNILPPPATELPGTPYWNKARWNQAFWSPAVNTQFRWDGISGLGYCASIVISVSVNKETEYIGADIAFETGDSM